MHRHAVTTPRRALSARLVEPPAEIAGQHGIEPFADERRQTRRRPAGRNRQRDAIAPDHAAQKRAGVRRIVDRVHEHLARLGGRGDFTIGIRRRRRHDQPHAVEIRRSEGASLDGHARSLDLLTDLDRHDAHIRPSGQQLAQLGSSDRPASDKQGATAGEVNEKR